MVNLLMMRMWEAALSLPSVGNLIDRFLDWMEELSAVMAPPATDGLIYKEVRVRELRD